MSKKKSFRLKWDLLLSPVTVQRNTFSKGTYIFPTCSGKGETISCHMLRSCWSCKKLQDCIKGRQRKAVFAKLGENAVESAYPEGLNGKCLTHILTNISAESWGSYNLYFMSGSNTERFGRELKFSAGLELDRHFTLSWGQMRAKTGNSGFELVFWYPVTKPGNFSEHSPRS